MLDHLWDIVIFSGTVRQPAYLRDSAKYEYQVT